MTAASVRYPGSPPASPFLGPGPSGLVYEHVQTAVRATLAEGTLAMPAPRASFHVDELAAAFQLDDAARAALAEANRAAAAASDAPRLPVELGRAWWRYTTSRAELRLAWPSADIVVPDLLLFAHRTTGLVTTVLVWPEEARSIVLPDAAAHVVVRGRRATSGLVPRALVMQALAGQAHAYPAPVPHLRYRGHEGHARLFAALAKAPGDAPAAYRPVRADAVVDTM